MTPKHTPGPWRLDIQRSPHSGEIIDCFVSAPDVNGFAYRAEVFGDDEYRDDMGRKVADFTLAAAAPDLLEALEGLLVAQSKHDERICCDGLHCGCTGATVLDQAEHYAREAIAKARGEQS